MRLRFFDELTQTEIAARVGLSQMQVSRLIRHSLEHLRALAVEPGGPLSTVRQNSGRIGCRSRNLGYTAPIVGLNDDGLGDGRRHRERARVPGRRLRRPSSTGSRSCSGRPGRDRRFTWCNQRWLDFTGRTLAEELGDGWTAGRPSRRPRPIPRGTSAGVLRARGAVHGWSTACAGPTVSTDGSSIRASRGGVRTARSAASPGLCVDVHETRITLEEFRLRERQQAMVADFGRFALEVDDEQELLDIAVKLLGDGLSVSLTAAMRAHRRRRVARDHDRHGMGPGAARHGPGERAARRRSRATHSRPTEPVVSDDLLCARPGSRAAPACAAMASSAP